MSTIIDPHFFPLDDEQATAGKNGKPAVARQVQGAITTLNRINYSGRTLFSWWGGQQTTSGSNNCLRTVYNHHHQAANANADTANGPDWRWDLLATQYTATAVAQQGVIVEIDGADYGPFETAPGSAASARVEPTQMDLYKFSTYVHTNYVASFGKYDMSLGAYSSNAPRLLAGCVYEPARNVVPALTAATSAWVPQDFVAPDNGIVATGVGSSLAHNNRYRLMLLHAWNRKRPTWGWSNLKPGSFPIGFSTSTQSYRYIFDQTIGDGGTAPSTTGPGITIPLRYAASGLNTTISCAVYVYAAMSGATNTGSVAISHKAAGGASMTSFSTGTSPATITGTTFQWYPSLTTTANTHLLRADLTYDRVLVAAKSSGATDHVRIGAIAIFPMHSATIT